MSGLVKMMEKDGWEFGHWVNWGCMYFSFRKGKHEIMLRDITRFIGNEKEQKHFTPWVKESSESVHKANEVQNG